MSIVVVVVAAADFAGHGGITVDGPSGGFEARIGVAIVASVFGRKEEKDKGAKKKSLGQREKKGARVAAD